MIIPFHAGLHALVARLFGAGVRFGVPTFGKPIVAPYTVVETPLTARRSIAVTLAPLSLSLILLALAWLLCSDFWALVYIFNTVGMAGDFIVTLALLGLSPDVEAVGRGEALVSSSGTLEPYPLWVSKALRLSSSRFCSYSSPAPGSKSLSRTVRRIFKIFNMKLNQVYEHSYFAWWGICATSRKLQNCLF